MNNLEHLEVLEGVEELDGEPSNQVVVESLGSGSTKSKGVGAMVRFAWHGGRRYLH